MSEPPDHKNTAIPFFSCRNKLHEAQKHQELILPSQNSIPSPTCNHHNHSARHLLKKNAKESKTTYISLPTLD